MNRISFFRHVCLPGLLVVLLGVAMPRRVAAQQAGIEQPTRGVDASAPTNFSGSGPDDYVISPEDVLRISVYGAPDFSQTVRVSTSGQVSLPLIGHLQAAGITVAEFQQNLARRLDARYLQNAQVSVLVEEFHGQPVVVAGAVKNPGVIQLLRPRPLTDILARAGGLTQEAGNDVILSRPGKPDVRVAIRDLLSEGNVGNLMVEGGDTVRVPQAGLVYVLGEVGKPGGFPLADNRDISVMQALALAEGIKHTAAEGSARLVKILPDGSRRVIPIDLSRILHGKAPDPIMAANDILVVPNSAGKIALGRGIDASLAVLIGGFTYGRF